MWLTSVLSLGGCGFWAQSQELRPEYYQVWLQNKQQQQNEIKNKNEQKHQIKQNKNSGFIFNTVHLVQLFEHSYP